MMDELLTTEPFMTTAEALAWIETRDLAFAYSMREASSIKLTLGVLFYLNKESERHIQPDSLDVERKLTIACRAGKISAKGVLDKGKGLEHRECRDMQTNDWIYLEIKWLHEKPSAYVAEPKSGNQQEWRRWLDLQFNRAQVLAAFPAHALSASNPTEPEAEALAPAPEPEIVTASSAHEPGTSDQEPPLKGNASQASGGLEPGEPTYAPRKVAAAIEAMRALWPSHGIPPKGLLADQRDRMVNRELEKTGRDASGPTIKRALALLKKMNTTP